jgi:hypothetical protein
MSNIEMILKNAAPEAVGPDPKVIDADLARGRAALANARRRRIYRGTAASVASLAVAGAGAIVIATSGTSAHPASHPASHGIAQAHDKSPIPGATAVDATHQPQIELVDYTGTQLPGFTVGQIPQGWHLSTSTSTALLITPDGSSNNDPDDFENKLAVLTSSVDQHGLGPGTPVSVGGQPGRVSKQSGVLMLTYNSPNGFGVVIQAPSSLDWTSTQIVAFAEGVQVTANAVHTHG